MVVRENSKEEVTCRWFAGDALKEKKFLPQELLPFSGGGLAERLEKARTRIAEQRQEEMSERELARRIFFMVEQSKHGGPPVPESIVKLVEDAKAGSEKAAKDPA
jgi:hypothetical protein